MLYVQIEGFKDMESLHNRTSKISLEKIKEFKNYEKKFICNDKRIKSD